MNKKKIEKKSFYRAVKLLNNKKDISSFLDRHLFSQNKDIIYFDEYREFLINKINSSTSFEDVRGLFKATLSFVENEIIFNSWLKDYGYFKYLIFSKKLIVVSITHECNANCSYCKISLGLKKESHMKFSDFLRVLDWLDEQEIKMFILTGGEPTIHPDFEKMMRVCKERGFEVIFYSNFFFNNSLINIFEPKLFNRVTVHYNPQYENDPVRMKIFNKNIDNVLSGGVMLEPRFVLQNNNYDKFLNFVEEKKFKFFTLNILHPSIYSSKNALTENKIEEWRKLFFNFLSETKKRDLNFYILKPLPRCMFTENEYLELKDKLRIWTTCVDRSQITVKPDLKVTWCNTDLFRPVKNIFDFKTTYEWNRYFWKFVEPLYWDIPSMPKCEKCKYFLNKECQGGCLAFKNLKKIPQSDIFNYDSH